MPIDKLSKLITALFIAAFLLIIPMRGLSHAGHAAIALSAFSIILWTTEAMPLTVTALIILVAQPLLKITSFNNAVIHFASPVLFLMIGGFIIAAALYESGLARRFTYKLLSKFGSTPSRILLVMIISAAVLSSWVESIVAFSILLPMVKELISLTKPECITPEHGNFSKAIILGVSYGALAGGLMTEIGAVPNLIATAYTHISFLKWMIFGLPLSLFFMLVVWRVLLFIFPFKHLNTLQESLFFKEAYEKLGPITRSEIVAALILLFTLLLWSTTSITNLNSAAIALMGSILFLTMGILDWHQVQKDMDWGLIMFFGGTLSLSSALLNTKAAQWIIMHLIGEMGHHPSSLMILLVLMVTTVIFTQVLSNIALGAILVPLSVSIARSLHHSVSTYAIPVAIACSLSFMFPISDPTIAMAYSTGHFKMREILKPGLIFMMISLLFIMSIAFMEPSFLYYTKPFMMKVTKTISGWHLFTNTHGLTGDLFSSAHRLSWELFDKKHCLSWWLFAKKHIISLRYP